MWIRGRKRLQLEKKKQISPPATAIKDVKRWKNGLQDSFAKKVVLHGETHARSGVSLTVCFSVAMLFKEKVFFFFFFFHGVWSWRLRIMCPWLQMKKSSFPKPQLATPTEVFATLLVNEKEEKFQQGSGSTVDMTWLITQWKLYVERTDWIAWRKYQWPLLMYNQSEV